MPSGPTFHHTDFAPEALAAGRQLSVAVCIPARNESATIGPIVDSVRTHFCAEAGGVDLVDEIVVVDDGSTDATADIASEAGATVIEARGGGGKGEAMQLAVQSSSGDLIVFLDGDVERFPDHFVTGLLGPVLTGDFALVKATYSRPLNGIPGEGGRVNELVARPIISLLYPDLSGIRQPLAGETAAPRTVLEKVRLAPAYGVELAPAHRRRRNVRSCVDRASGVGRARPSQPPYRPADTSGHRSAQSRSRALGTTSWPSKRIRRRRAEQPRASA